MFKQNTKALQKNEKSDLDSITIPLFKRSAFLIIAICFLLG